MNKNSSLPELPKKKWRKRLFKFFAISFCFFLIVIAALLYWVKVYVLDEENVKQLVCRELKKMVNGEVTLEGVSWISGPFLYKGITFRNATIQHKLDMEHHPLFAVSEILVLFKIQWSHLISEPIILKKIIIQKPQLSIHRNRSKWNILDIYSPPGTESQIPTEKGRPPSLPQVEIHDATILYLDHSLFRGPIKAQIKKAHFDQENSYTLDLKIEEEHLKDIDLSISGTLEFYNSQEKKITIRLKTNQEIKLDCELVKILSKELHLEEEFEKLRSFNPSGTISFEMEMEVDEKRPGQPQFGFTLALSKLHLMLDPLTVALKDFQGKITKKLDEDTIYLKEGQGWLEDGKIEVEGKLAKLDPSADVSLKVTLKSLELKDSLKEKLPSEAQKIWEDFNFKGSVHTICSVSRTKEKGLVIGPSMLEIKNGSIQHHLVKFPVENIQGKIHLKENQLSVAEEAPLTIEALNGKIEIWGELFNLEDVPEFKAYAKLHKIHSLQSLYDTLPPGAQEIWNILGPKGNVDGKGEASGKLTGNIEDIDWRAEVFATDLFFKPGVFPMPVYGVSGRVVATQKELLLIDGKGFDNKEKKGKPNLFLDYGRIAPINDGEVKLKLRGENIAITKEIYYAVRHADTEDDTGKILDRYLPWGRVSVGVDIYAPVGVDTDFDVSIFIDSLDTQMNVQPFPESKSGRIPFHKITGRVEILPEGIFMKKLQGELYHGGVIALNGQFLEETDQLNLKITGKTVGLHQTLKNALEPEGREVWGMLSPRGSVDLDVDLEQHGDEEPNIRIKIKPDSCRVSYEKFPYPLRLRNKGTIQVDSEKVLIQGVKGVNGDSVLGIDGTILRTKDGSPVGLGLSLKSEKLILNEELHTSLPPEIKEVWDLLSLTGEVQFEGKLSRDKGKEEIDHLVKIHSLKTSVTYKEFPYRLDNVNGLVSFDSKKGLIKLINVEGERNGASIRLKGRVEIAKTDKKILLNIRARNLLVNQELKKAIHSKHHHVWEMFDPFGLVDVNARFTKNFGEPLTHKTKIVVKKGTIRYEEFSLPIENLEGIVEIENERVLIKQLSGNTKKALISLAGSLEDNVNSSLLEITSQFSGLPLNDDFGRALPKEFRDIWKKFSPKGLTSGTGTLTVLTNSDGKSHISYFGKIGLQKGAIHTGLNFRNIEGNIDFQGKFYDRKHILKGHLDFKTLSITDLFPKDLTLKNATTDVLMQSDYLLLRDAKATLYGGKIFGEILVHNSSIQPFMIDLQVRNTDLEKLTEDISNLNEEEDSNPIEGNLDAGIEIQGNSGEIETVVGEGWIDVKKAKLWKLPLFLSIFDLFNLASGSSFESGSVEFKIRKKLVTISKMRFASNPLSLKGYGIMDFDLDLDFYFNTVIAPSLFPKIPMLTEAWHELKGNFILLRVYGPVNDLTTSISTFRAVGEAFGVEQKPDLSEIKKKKKSQESSEVKQRKKRD